VPMGLHYISALGLSTEEAFGRARRATKELGITLLMIDSWGPLMQGDMANAKDVISFYNRYLAPFVAEGITVFIVDHQSRVQDGQNYQKKGAFGSVYKENLLRSVLQVQKVDENRDEEGRIRVRVRHRKSNFGPTFEPFEAIIEFGGGKITAKAMEMLESEKATEETLSGRDRVRAALVKGEATAKELAEDTGLSVGTVRNILSELVPDEVGIAHQEGTTKHYALAFNLSSLLTPKEQYGDNRSEENEKLWEGVQ